MDMIFWLIDRVARLVAPRYDPHAPQPITPSGVWPEDPYGPAIHDFTTDLRDYEVDREFTEALNKLWEDQEVVTTTQWGLELPSGEVQWGFWSGIAFDSPLNRLRMVATLQKTALDMGFTEGAQSDEFLKMYRWQTREQIARIRYGENTEAFSLTDPAVSAAPVENSSHEQPQDDSDLNSHREVHAGYLGGDA
jgi:hypothetical protein